MSQEEDALSSDYEPILTYFMELIDNLAAIGAAAQRTSRSAGLSDPQPTPPAPAPDAVP